MLTHMLKHTHTRTHWLCVPQCAACWHVWSLLQGSSRAACHCLSSVMDVPFVARTHTHTYTDRQTDRQWRGSARPSCPPKDEFLLCLGKRMWSHSLKIQPMSLATHDLIQASPLCRAPSPSPLLLLLSLALPAASYLLPLPIYLSIYPSFFISYWWWKPIENDACVNYGGYSRL